MAATVTVNSLVSKARKRADAETSVESQSICPDAEIIEYLNEGYRQLYDLLVELCGLEYFGKQSTLASPYTLPADFYQLLGIDFGAVGSEIPLAQFAFAERTQFVDGANPRYRIRSGSVIWRPATFASAVTLHYVPVAATLAAGGTFDSFNGWDEYVVAWAVRSILSKQEYDLSTADGYLARAETRIRRSAPRIRAETQTIVDVETFPDQFYM